VINFTYSIATEHEHSCCILIAREDKFKPLGVWHTWIDYPKFNSLIQQYYSSKDNKNQAEFTFSSEEYMCKTPDWALYQSKEKGFDPVENRWRRNNAIKGEEEKYVPSESGCG